MKISLDQQIACLRRELALRERVYPLQCAKGKLRESEAQFEIASMRASLNTLIWIQRNEETIRAAIDAAKPGDAA